MQPINQPRQPHQPRTFCNYVTGLANIVSDRLRFNPAQLDELQQAKQSGLDNFAGFLSDSPATDCHLLLQRGINGIRLPDNPDQHSVQKLFDNRTVFVKQCTESGALAMAALALKVFGSTLLVNDRIDHDRLNMAMRMLFGNDMDELGGSIKYDFTTLYRPLGAYYVLKSRHYSIEVRPTFDQQKRDEQFAALIAHENLDGGHFHSRTTEHVLELFMADDSVPDELSECIGLDFVKPVKITADNTATGIARMSARMDKGALAHSSSSTTTLSDRTEVRSTVTSRYFADSNPSILRKVQKHLDPGQNYSWANRVINATRMEHTLDIGTHTVSTEKFAFAAVNSFQEATRIVAGVFGDAPLEQEKKYLFTDIRLLNRGKPAERALYEKHVALMGAACFRRGITYCPYLQEAHSNIEDAVCTLRHATYLPRYTYSGIESGSYNGRSLKLEYETLFEKLPSRTQEYYRDTMNIWRGLYDQGEVVDGGVPFVTLTQILGRVYAAESGKLRMGHGKGCKSAKDRATSVACGELQLETLIETEFHRAQQKQRKPNIRRFFQGGIASGHFNYEDLPPDDRLLMKHNFDRALLHAANRNNTGVATNISTYPLTSYFSEVPFIASAKIYTVDVPA